MLTALKGSQFYFYLHVIHKIMTTCFFRLVHSGRQLNSTTGSDTLTFGTRSGTRNGVETHIFRVETQRDLAHWSRALVQGSHGAAMLVKEVTCGKGPLIFSSTARSA